MALIAVTACAKPDDYRHAIEHVGGDVRVVDASMDPAAALDGADGLMLTGGEDVAPERYGETPHPSVVAAAPERDAFEIALALEARRRRLPILAICRGIQVLNVACGGTLVQDIPSDVPGAADHSLKVPRHRSFDLAHDIWVDDKSQLSGLLRERLGDGDSVAVNSRHHQAVKQVAEGFAVVATAPDGVIEAIEEPSLPFCLGVQWHPENFWRTGEFRALFEGLLEAAGRK